jgi:hypothetical protein
MPPMGDDFHGFGFTTKPTQRTLPYTSKFSTSKFVEISNAYGGDSASV